MSSDQNQKEEEVQQSQPKITQADIIAQRVNESQRIHEFWKTKWADKLGFLEWVRFELVMELGKKAFS
jgi:hypothetical protein